MKSQTCFCFCFCLFVCFFIYIVVFQNHFQTRWHDLIFSNSQVNLSIGTGKLGLGRSGSPPPTVLWFFLFVQFSVFGVHLHSLYHSAWVESSSLLLLALVGMWPPKSHDVPNLHKLQSGFEPWILWWAWWGWDMMGRDRPCEVDPSIF